MKKNILILLVGLITGTTLTATAAYVYTARDIGYQPSDENWSVNNVQEALSELKSDVNNINNKVEGIERVYKAGEVELVALVLDDSFYKDSNNKYVLSNSDTGRTLLADTSTYKSLASTEECLGEVGADTAIPFKNGITVTNITEFTNTSNGLTISDSNNYKKYILTITMQTNGSPDYRYINISSMSNADYTLLNEKSISFYGGSTLRTYLITRLNDGDISIHFNNDSYPQAKMISLCALS